jgi:hypothetical protein
MGYGFSPLLVYGVMEKKNSSCIDGEDLEALYIESYATEVNKGYAMEIVYGCNVALDQYKTGASFEGKEQVESFAEKFAHLFKSPKPEFFLVLRGDFEVSNYYKLDEDAVNKLSALMDKAREKALEKETQGKAKKSKRSD